MAFGTELAVSFTEGIFGIKLVYYEYPSIQFPGSIMVYIIYNLVDQSLVYRDSVGGVLHDIDLETDTKKTDLNRCQW